MSFPDSRWPTYYENLPPLIFIAILIPQAHFVFSMLHHHLVDAIEKLVK
jgi:hypothetical protein